MTKNYHDGHRKRLKQRFINEGIEQFQQHEVLELLLFFVIPRKDTNLIAHKLIDKFGDLAGVFDASYEELIKVEGVGQATAVFIKAIPAFSMAYLDTKHKEGIILNTIEKTGKYLLPKFIGKTNEVVYLICLDSKGKVLKSKTIIEGSVNASQVSIRIIAEEALSCGAVSVVLAHNHPSGLAIPSETDIKTTGEISKALKMLGIKLLDHIIVADNDYISLAISKGFLNIF
ncbi:MAG: RadC family protein [Oscillospiraceae bacterium]|nr:RadC family protein [Oscillospiraceae bacterium]